MVYSSIRAITFPSLIHPQNRTTSAMRKKFQLLPCALQTQTQLHTITRSISIQREKATLSNPMPLFLLVIGSVSPLFISFPVLSVQ